jgi:uncharacterized protein YbcI
MKTQGEIESAISDGITRFELEFIGRGPKCVRSHLVDDLLIVRVTGVLTAAEQHLVKTAPAEKGRDLLKDVRRHLIETGRPLIEAMVQGIVGIKVVTLHYDISSATGEEVVIFTLAETPLFRETERKRNYFSDSTKDAILSGDISPLSRYGIERQRIQRLRPEKQIQEVG